MARFQRDPYVVCHPAPHGGWYLIPLRHADGALEENILYLGEVAGRLWELLETGQSHEALVARILDEYEVEAGVLTADVDHFLRRLTELSAVFTDDSPG